MNYISFEGEYRYPKQVDKSAMVGVDVMIMATTVLNQKQVLHNLSQSQQVSYSSEILTLIDKLNTLLNSSVNAKVLMPTTP